MKRTTIYLDDGMRKALQSLATYRVSFSEHIRRAIDRYVRDMGVDIEAVEEVDEKSEVEDSNDDI